MRDHRRLRFSFFTDEPALARGYPDEKGSLHYLLGSILKRMDRNAEAAQALDRVCASAPACNVQKVREQTVNALKEAGLSAAETGIAVTPQTPIPTSGEDLILDGATHAVKEAALEAEKKRIEEEKRQREEEAKKKQKDQRKQRCQGGDGTGECAIEDPYLKAKVRKM